MVSPIRLQSSRRSSIMAITREASGKIPQSPEQGIFAHPLHPVGHRDEGHRDSAELLSGDVGIRHASMRPRPTCVGCAMPNRGSCPRAAFYGGLRERRPGKDSDDACRHEWEPVRFTRLRVQQPHQAVHAGNRHEHGKRQRPTG